MSSAVVEVVWENDCLRKLLYEFVLLLGARVQRAGQKDHAVQVVCHFWSGEFTVHVHRFQQRKPA